MASSMASSKIKKENPNPNTCLLRTFGIWILNIEI
jgi:hypothetical protein